MNYQQTLNFLYNKLPMFSRVGSVAFKKDLTNTIALCNALGNPHQKFKSIHVGGTNGKGSVSHMLAAILQSSGYKTGLYTSPHLYDFRERIKVNGELITEDFVVQFVQKVQPLIEEIKPSFFEITVAMAFQYFAEQKVEVAIIEVGLGGRLDSTNIITPELSVITNIGWDHMNMLGNSLEEIAAEKAGIIKENIPVIIGEALPETKPVFQKIATQKKAPIVFADEKFSIQQVESHHNYLELALCRENGSEILINTDLPGIYQTKNLRSVFTAIDVLKNLGWKIDDAIVLSALKEVKKQTGLMGRWEVIHHSPTVVLEVAHNKEGIEQMLQHIKHLSFNKLHLVFGTVKDKDIEPVLALLPTDAHYYFTQAHIPRALPAADLYQASKKFFLTGEVYEEVNLALHHALENASAQDLIIVCGSIFLVAEVNRSNF